MTLPAPGLVSLFAGASGFSRMDLAPLRRVPAALALLLSAACGGMNSQTHAFATLIEARQSGAIATGRMPEGLPPSSHDIREAHVPGTSQRWGIINFPQSEAHVLRALLQAEQIPLDGHECDIPARIEWWPIELRGVLNGTRIAATGTQGYRARNGELIFAVNWRQGRAYYWAAPSR